MPSSRPCLRCEVTPNAVTPQAHPLAALLHLDLRGEAVQPAGWKDKRRSGDRWYDFAAVVCDKVAAVGLRNETSLWLSGTLLLPFLLSISLLSDSALHTLGLPLAISLRSPEPTGNAQCTTQNTRHGG